MYRNKHKNQVKELYIRLKSLQAKYDELGKWLVNHPTITPDHENIYADRRHLSVKIASVEDRIKRLQSDDQTPYQELASILPTSNRKW